MTYIHVQHGTFTEHMCNPHAGFTSKQAFKMGIPAIGIVAVLVANVTFIAWATPPGELVSHIQSSLASTQCRSGCPVYIFHTFGIQTRLHTNWS